MIPFHFNAQIYSSKRVAMNECFQQFLNVVPQHYELRFCTQEILDNHKEKNQVPLLCHGQK